MTLQFDAVSDIPSLIAARVALTPDQPAFHYRTPSDEWRGVSWKAYQDDVTNAARALVARGMRPGDTAAIVAPQSYFWEVVDKAVLTCGGVVAGIDHLASPEQKNWYIKKIKPSCLVLANERQLAEVSPELLNGLRLIVTFEGAPSGSALPWTELTSAQWGPHSLPEISPDAMATIVFTSGSSGEPKIVQYSQTQLVLAAKSVLQACGPADESDSTLCWLPLSNLFQRVMNLCAIGAGGRSYFSAEPRRIMEDIADVGPTHFIGVPRFYEKIAEKAEAAIAELPAWQRELLRRAMAARAEGLEQADAHAAPQGFRHPILTLADHFLLRALRRRIFGPRIRLLITGSAATPLPVKRFFAGIGLPLMEAYAMTENIIPMSVSRNSLGDDGSVGRPLPENDIRIDESGEIQVRGAGVFSGYLGEGDSAQRFTADGYFRTGDEGRFDAEGRLHLTGRKSDLIKTSTGRRIPPTPIESALRAAPLVQEAVIVGNGRKCLTAVLALDQEAMRGRSSQELLSQLSQLVRQTNDTRASYERIAGCVVLRKGFSIDEGHLTTNLKPRRGRIEDAVAQPLEQLYQSINDNGVGQGAVQRVDDIAFAEAS